MSDPKVVVAARGGNTDVGGKITGVVRTSLGAIGGFVNGLIAINRYKLASIMVWFVGVYATSLVMNGMGNGNFRPDTLVDSITIGWYTNQLIGAFVVQALFTVIEAPIFQRRGVNALSLFVVVLDTLVNAVVVGPFAEGFVSSDAWRYFELIVNVLSFRAIDVSSVNTEVFIVLLTIFGGVGIAAAPEMLWNWGSRGNR